MSGVAVLKDQLAEFGISIDTLRARGMRRQEVPSSLEVAEVGTDGREHKMVPSAAQAWREMKAQALLDGEEIFISLRLPQYRATNRDYSTQVGIWHIDRANSQRVRTTGL